MKTIVITGATRGLGKALTEEFIRQGQRVFGCGRNEKEIQVLNDTFGPQNQFQVLDITDFSAVQSWADSIENEIQCPNFLINNAAVVNNPNLFHDVPAKELESLVKINILGMMHVLKAFLPSFYTANAGMIINLSSGAGRMGLPNLAPYCSTKWAVEGLSKSISEEVPKGVGVVPLSPGMVATDMLYTCYGEPSKQQVDPVTWAKSAVPFILGLTPKDSGTSLSTP